jgi:hypothetical protein
MSLNGIALILLLVPIALISIGTINDIDWLWWAGVGLLVLGALIPPAARFLGSDDEGGEDKKSSDKKKASDEKKENE